MHHKHDDHFRQHMLQLVEQQWDTLKEAAHDLLDATDLVLQIKSPEELDELKERLQALRLIVRERLGEAHNGQKIYQETTTILKN